MRRAAVGAPGSGGSLLAIDDGLVQPPGPRRCSPSPEGLVLTAARQGRLRLPITSPYRATVVPASTGDGLRITVGRSKTDQEGEGAVVGIAYGTDWRTCPVRAWRAWVEAARLVDGPAFRNLRNGAVTGERIAGGGIARVVKRRAQAAGLDPALFQRPLAAQRLRDHRGTPRRTRAQDHASGTVDDECGHARLHPRGRVVRQQPVSEVGL
jgi:hypothetical protein